MTRRARVVGLPGLVALLVTASGLALVQGAGIEPVTTRLDWHHPLQFYLPWLLALPLVGGATALWSRTVTGTPPEIAAAALVPAMAEAGFQAIATVADLAGDVATGHHSVWHTLCGLASFSISRLLAPAVLLATGALAVVAVDRTRSGDAGPAGTPPGTGFAPEKPRRSLDPAVLWCSVAGAALVTAVLVGRAAGLHSLDPAPPRFLILVWFLCLGLAVFATWRLVRLWAYASLLLLAALGLALAAPGRARDVATWRLEWGVFGLLWTGAAVTLFVRLLLRLDELERRIHLEGAALGLAMAVPLSIAYALFEQHLPPLSAQWVAIALVLTWWCGRVVALRRYR